MPANSTNIATAGALKVNGNNKAIVNAGPIPGRTPTRVPAKQPANP